MNVKKITLLFLLTLALILAHHPATAAPTFIHTTQADWMRGERQSLDVRTLDALGTPYGLDQDEHGAMRLRSQPGAWMPHPDNPVMVPGEAGAWDDAVISEAKVVWHDGMFHMWYAGRWRDPQGRKTPMDLGYATSPDGVHWSKYRANPVLQRGPLGSTDENLVSAPSVVYDGELWRMWYSAVNFKGDWSIHYATSTDGVNWLKSAQNPLMQETHDQRWDAVYIAEPFVLWNGRGWQMWYNGASAQSDTLLGYAESADGLTWKRLPGNRPVLNIASTGQWDDFSVARASVMFDGERYQMWYEGHDGTTWRIGYATSPNGISWERGPHNPVIDLGPAGAWDSKVASEPNVIFDGQLYRMYHSGYDGDRYRVGLFTAPPIYESTGLFLSPVISHPTPLQWGMLACDMTLPSQTGVGLDVLTSDDGQTWTTWPDVAEWRSSAAFSGTQTVDLYEQGIAASRFLRYRLTLNTADPAVSPLVRQITVSEERPTPTPTPTHTSTPTRPPAPTPTATPTAMPTSAPLPTATPTALPTRGPTPTPPPPPPPPTFPSGSLTQSGWLIAVGGIGMLGWLAATTLINRRRPAANEGQPEPRRRWTHWGWNWAWSLLGIPIILLGAYQRYTADQQRRQAETEYQVVVQNWDTGENVPAPWLSDEQIRQAIGERLVSPCLRPIAVQYLTHTVTLHTADLGFQSNADTLIIQAIQANHTDAGQRELEAFFWGRPQSMFEFTHTFNYDLLLPWLQNIAAQIDRQPVPHRLDASSLTVSSGQAGRALDMDESLRRLRAAIADYTITHVVLPVQDIPPQALSQTQIDAFLAGTAPAWSEPPQPPVSRPITIPFDYQRWIARTGLPARDWQPTRPMTGYTFLPGEMGWTLDITAARGVIQDAIAQGRQDVSLKITATVPPPPLTLADIKPALLDIAGHFSGLTAFYVQDLSSGEEISHHAGITTSGMSMIKVAIMATAYRVITRPFAAPLQDAMAQMIAHSINEKSNYVILQIGEGDFAEGLQRINETLAALDMRQTYIRQAYRVEGQYYPAIDIPRHPAADIPPEDRLNVWPDTAMQTSLTDQAKLFRALYQGTQGGGRLLEAFPNLTAQDCQAMLDLLKTNPTRTFLGPGFADSVPMAHKNGFGGGTGTDERMNVGIIWPPQGRPYLVGLYQWDKQDWIHWLRVWPQQIEFSTTLYNYFTMPQ